MMIVENNPNISGWSLDSGYKNKFSEENYPFQPAFGERINILSMMLAINSWDIEYQCRGCDKGFRMILTMPGDTVEISQNYIRLPISVLNIIALRVKLTITSEGLRSYRPDQRQCFYSADNRLRFFKIYSEANCKAECLSNFTRIECGCVKFSMPSKTY